MDDSLRRLVLQRASADALRESAVAGGMVPLNQDGMNKALQGLTTLEEVARVKEF
jgi:type IV pilus assembly protein PilB